MERPRKAWFREPRAWATTLIGAAVIALVLLAGSLPDFRLRPGQRFSLPPGGPNPDGGASGVTPLMGEVAQIGLTALYVLIVALVPVTIVYLAVSSEARRIFLRYLPALLLPATLAMLLYVRPEPFTWVEEVQPLNLVPEPGGPVAVFEATPSPGWVWATKVVLATLILAAVAGLVRWFWPRRRPASPLEQLVQEAQTAIDALQSGADVRNTVLRCYAEMGRVVSEARGVVRGEAMTAREFERRLVGLGLPEGPVQQLTRLFEAVRYGTLEPGEAEGAQAVGYLSSIVQACGQAA